MDCGCEDGCDENVCAASALGKEIKDVDKGWTEEGWKINATEMGEYVLVSRIKKRNRLVTDICVKGFRVCARSKLLIE